MRITYFILLGTLAVACGDISRGGDGGMNPDGDGGTNPDAVPGIDGNPEDSDASPGTDKLDVLFVVDNSGSMFEEQAALATAFGSNFIDNLRHDGVLPSLHIGVVSTDLGAGPFNISGCTGNGDNGVLQNAPRSKCDPPSDRYIIDLDNGDGTRTTNYTGTLAQTFSCIARLGTNGCGFEQPLESMRRALNGSHPANIGFLRANAALLVVIVSDEDDCSTENTDMFDTSQTSPKDPLGPLSSFRCFEFGVECNPDTPRAGGMKFSCEPREDSPYMFAIGEYIDFLTTLKGGNVVVAAIVGDRTPVIVNVEAGVGFDLAPSCSVGDSGRNAVPGVRLHALLDGFPSRNIGPSICADMAASLQAITDLVNERLL